MVIKASVYIIFFSLGEKSLKTKEQKQNKTKPKNSSYQALNISFQFGQISDYKVIKLVQISCQVSAGKSVNISGSTEELH